MNKKLVSTLMVIALILLLPQTVFAQAEQPPVPPKELDVFTSYPSMEIGLGESVSIRLTVRTETQAQVVRLEMEEMPESWSATFRGDSHNVHAVYVEPGEDSRVTVQIKQPGEVKAGDYRFVVLATGANTKVRLPLELKVKEKIPSSISLNTELPTIVGSSSKTFRYNVKLKNEGDDDLTIDLYANAPRGFLVTIKSSGQEVTSLPLKANETKNLSIEAKPIVQLEEGKYPIQISAQGENVASTVDLVAEITGQADLSITGQDGRLSGQAEAGKETPLKIILENRGSATARGIELSSSAPAGWTVTLDPQMVEQLPAGEEIEITAKIIPAEKALAGDYMLTFKAKPADGSSASSDFRITVRTSTLWGVAGLGLIAVAIGVVGVAVFRFGRR